MATKTKAEEATETTQDDLQAEIEAEKSRNPHLAVPSDPGAEGWARAVMNAKAAKEKSEAMAHLIVELDELREKKTKAARSMTAKIKLRETAVRRLADEVESGKEWISPQGALPGV